MSIPIERTSPPSLVSRLLTRRPVERGLLACGVGYGVAYVIASDLVAATIYEGYSRRDQAISELSATGAPSRGFLNGMLPAFTLLVLGFGLGVWRAAGDDRKLRVVGAVLIAQGLLFPVWLLFPMSSRAELVEGRGGANDIGHVVLSVLAVSLILLQMGFGGAALGRRFRMFSIAMALTAIAAGAYTGTTTSDVSAGNPTPWMGVVERVSYGSWLLWMAALAVLLLRRRPAPASEH